MESLKAHLLTICGAAMICAIVDKFSENNHRFAILKTMCGLFMTITILFPLSNLDFEGWSIGYDLKIQAAEIINIGEAETHDALKTIIKDKSEAYIQQKAQSLHADISTEVQVSGDPIPMPDMVYLYGQIGPYAKQQLQNTIAQDLGIPKEKQIWK